MQPAPLPLTVRSQNRIVVPTASVLRHSERALEATDLNDVYRALLKRAQAAAEAAERHHQHASELHAFVRALRRRGPAELVLCAWCGRVAAEGHWIDPAPLLGADLRRRLFERASHGICPDCFEQVEVEAHRARGRQ